MNINELKGNMTYKEMSYKTGIPVRTLENWGLGTRTPPPYMYDLIKAKLLLEESAEPTTEESDS